jgi:hypothetical protein
VVHDIDLRSAAPFDAAARRLQSNDTICDAVTITGAAGLPNRGGEIQGKCGAGIPGFHSTFDFRC